MAKNLVTRWILLAHGMLGFSHERMQLPTYVTAAHIPMVKSMVVYSCVGNQWQNVRMHTKHAGHTDHADQVEAWCLCWAAMPVS